MISSAWHHAWLLCLFLVCISRFGAPSIISGQIQLLFINWMYSDFKPVCTHVLFCLVDIFQREAFSLVIFNPGNVKYPDVVWCGWDIYNVHTREQAGFG